MKLKDLGEFGFIDRIRSGVRDGRGVLLGIGDDCAALQLPAGELLLTSKDLLIEEVHFRRDWTGMADLGRKSVAVNISDIAAMGGTPHFLLLGLGIPTTLPLADLDDLMEGFCAACDEYGVTLAGGDTCRSPGPLLISVTAAGSIPPGELVRRSGAAPGDGIYVTGTLGDSALALFDLQQGRPPDPELLARHHRPTARSAAGRSFAAGGLATAMIDLSDGLLADLGHILAAANAGALLDAATLPLSAATEARLRQAPELFDLVLAGGEDYELLLTVAPHHEERLAELVRDWSLPVSRIGQVTPPDGGLLVKDREGGIRPMQPRGFNHFSGQG
ncbi:thiamine-phosphate kinase [Desulfuromonas carbonis]|uniref:thiamine-phosphate kinase n=1 Tax=Desulfuromonas sp. DDH964 TaxID=1823759 RepID=UPI00078BC70D|nr:thiamine-phosphate kinase [Desulfuromonas sp. DDH964]AMV73865.1 thiamin monophosphate kinase [Desulfuromonas sp. DDH964]